jgi:lipid-A-disaccharide synthase
LSSSLFVFVGDVSADHHAGRLISKIRERQPDLQIWGVGGPRMQEQGVEVLYDCQKFATLGVVEVFRQLPFFGKLRQEMLDQIDKRKPDAVLLVDFAGFNLGLAQRIRKRHPNLPIIYFISPQVWGSRPWRINVVRRTVTKMLVIFPFEEKLYRDAGIDASFVGHPLTLAIPQENLEPNKEEFCKANGLDPQKPLIGIFPGSRRQEIRLLLPVMLQAAKWLGKERPEVQFAISRANQILADAIDEVIDHEGMRLRVGHGITLLPVGENHTLMRAADILWAKSGTTTLEAALFGKPMLIYYRGNWVSFLLFLLFKRVRRVGWPNILAGKGVVPELLQLDCRPEQFVKYTSDWLDVPAAREEIGEELRKVRSRLGQADLADTAAVEVIKVLSAKRIESSPEVKTG